MDLQLFLVMALVTAAVAYLGRRAWRTWRGHGAGCGSCRCAAPQDAAHRGVLNGQTNLISVEDLTRRLRRSE